MRQYFRIFMFGGPVGLAYALKLARIKRRMRRVSAWIEREKETHREHLAALNAEMNRLVSEQQGTNIAAAQFQRYCEKMAGGNA